MKIKEKFRSITQIFKFITGIISWIVLVLLVIIAGFLLYYFVSTKIYAQKGENYKPAFALYTILTPSMVPNINVYDVIVDINVTKPTDIKEGDVITFISTASLTSGMTITHRVIEVIQDEKGYSYVTKGDANLSPDGAAVPFEYVLGKVAFRIPQLGRLQEFLGTKGGWLIVVVIPALIVIISDVLKVFRLLNVKNQVEGYNTFEDKNEKKKIEKKQEIVSKLARRYQTVRHEKEPDPLPKKVFVILDLLKKTNDIELPKRKDLPMLNKENMKKDKPKKMRKKSKK